MKQGEGRKVGPYVLEGRLGVGGMGVVHRARHADSGALVALKLLKVESAPPEALRRFEREARALLALDHPNVVRSYTFDQSADGQVYLAMELLRGETLAERIRRVGRLSAAEVARLGAQAASGLAAAHAAGIVHRDIKPGNLFLVRDPALSEPTSGELATGETVKLLDFGLALLASGDQTRITQPGMLMGTPSYMAPEQARGQRSEDARTDVWALGAVLYHALAGQPPFLGPTPLAELVRIIHEEPDALTADVARGVPQALSDAVRRALRKDPGERWESAVAFAEALASVDEDTGKTVSARGSRPTPAATPAPGSLHDEVRIVSVVVAEGVSDPDAFMSSVRAHGGQASAIIGGRAVGTFGGTESDGREALRAVQAALAVRESVVRIGIGTGRVVAEASGHGAVTGSTVAAAERALLARGVGIDSATRHQVARRFHVEPADAEGEAGWRLLNPANDETAPQVPWSQGVRNRVSTVGREVELAQLRDLFERTADEGEPAAALVLGDPGIGKSRLLWELERWLTELDEPVIVLKGRGDVARRFRAYATLAEAIRGHAFIHRDTEPEEAQRRLLRLCRRAGLPDDEALNVGAFLGEVVGAGFPETPALRTARHNPRVMRDQVQMAVAALIDRLAINTTVVLLVEDLHLADTPTLDVAEFLLIGEHRRLLLVATARPQLLSGRPEALPDAVRIPLGSLSRRAIRRIVREILGREDEAIVERAAGNPYFAEELAVGARDSDDAELPLTVQGAIQARLDHLPPDEKDLLKRAGVLGAIFWQEALTELGVSEPASALARLRRRDLIVPRPASSLAGCHEWAVRHGAVQEVAYGMLTPEQATALHRAAGTWLARQPDAQPANVAEQLEAGRTGNEPDDEATQWWVRAAVAADARGDGAEVLACSEQALQRLSQPAADVYAVRALRFHALTYMGHHEAHRAELEILEALAPELGPRERHEIRRGRAELLRRTGDFEGGQERYDEMLVEARSRGEATWIVRALCGVAGSWADRGQPQRGVAAADEAIELARQTDDPSLLCAALEARAYLAGVAGEGARAHALYSESATLMEKAGDVRRAARARMNAGVALDLVMAWERAFEQLSRAVAICDKLGLTRTAGYARLNLGQTLIHLGREPEAREALRRAMDAAARTQDRRLRCGCHYHLGIVELSAGDVSAALAEAERALADDTGGLRRGIVALQAMARLQAGDPEQALRLAREAVETDSGSNDVLEVDAWLCGHDALLALGQESEAAQWARTAARLVTQRAETIEDAELQEGYRRHPPHSRALSLAAGATASE